VVVEGRVRRGCTLARNMPTYYPSTSIHIAGGREQLSLNLAQREMHCNRPRIPILDLLMTTGERETGASSMPLSSSSSFSSPLSLEISNVGATGRRRALLGAIVSWSPRNHSSELVLGPLR